MSVILHILLFDESLIIGVLTIGCNERNSEKLNGGYLILSIMTENKFIFVFLPNLINVLPKIV